MMAPLNSCRLDRHRQDFAYANSLNVNDCCTTVKLKCAALSFVPPERDSNAYKYGMIHAYYGSNLQNEGLICHL